MNNNKQNSIDWLVEELQKYIQEPWKYVSKGGKEAIIEQAKDMHKNEVTSFTADWSIQWKYENSKSINQYYNETFNNNKL